MLDKEARFFVKKAALRSAPRLFAAGEQFDTRSVRRVSSDVHAAGGNDQTYFLPAGKKLCEAFLTDCKTPPGFSGGVCLSLFSPWEYTVSVRI